MYWFNQEIGPSPDAVELACVMECIVLLM